ncbi:MAG: hypothetical protein WAX80_00065 [Minisyncoccia bacterium]
MTKGDYVFMGRLLEKLRQTSLGKKFLHKKFAHYTWISIFISLLNIFLLWVFIDIWDIPTIISSSTVVLSTFIIRYLLFYRFETI